jgi:choline-glycine betaine transporter
VVSPYGYVRLGGRAAVPDFSYAGWFSMLFAAGMGIGLMSYGVSEPLSHFASSLGGTAMGVDGVRTDWAPLGAAAGNEPEAVRLGMAASIFHWGLHPGAICALVALSLPSAVQLQQGSATAALRHSRRASLTSITSLVGIVLVIVFFVTSSKSGSLVIDMITAGGKVDAPVPQRVFWCVLEGVVAVVLLLFAGGLQSRQSMAISTALPFTVVLLVMCVAIWRRLVTEPR